MARARLPVLLLLCGISNLAHACSCAAGFGPACQEAWSKYTQAVFLGKVLEIHSASGLLGALFLRREPYREVELEIEEPYLGVSGKHVVVYTAWSEPSCGYHFVEGERYVVYAGKQEGRLYVSMCSHTNLAKNAQDEIPYLRSLPSLPGTSSIIGNLWKYTHDPNFKPKFEPSLMDHYRPPEQVYRAMVPVPGTRITAVGRDGKEHSTMVGQDGDWQISGLAPGDYSVAVQLDESMYVYPFRSDVSVASKGCAAVNLRVELNGRIVGQVSHSPHGDSWVWIALVALSAEKPDLRHPVLEINLHPDQTDFELAPLPPGKYILGAYLSKKVQVDAHAHTFRDTAPTFYPGVSDLKAASPISVDAGQKRSGFSFRMLDLGFMPVTWRCETCATE